MKIHHPNWYDRDVEVKTIRAKQVLISVEIEAEDGKLYGLQLPVDLKSLNLTDKGLEGLAVNEIEKFRIE